MKTVFITKQVADLESQCSTQSAIPWHIIIDVKYTEREAAVIQAFITSLLNASIKNVIEQEAPT